MYAATNLNDVWLAFVSSIYALCCIVVIAVTAFKRLAHRRTKDMSPRSDANDQAWGGHLRTA